MSYCEDYHHNIKRGSLGWPEGLSTESQEWLTKKVVEVLEEYRMYGWLGMNVHEISERIFDPHRKSERPEELQQPFGFDWRYAACDRALRAADCLRIWVTSARTVEEPDKSPAIISTLSEKIREALHEIYETRYKGYDMGLYHGATIKAMREKGLIETRLNVKKQPKLYLTAKGYATLRLIQQKSQS